MKKSLFVILISTTIITACKKQNKEGVPMVNEIVISETDQTVMIHDIVPDTSVYPSTSQDVNLELDVNADGTNDFKFTIQSYFIFNHILLVDAQITIEPLNMNGYIVCDSIYDKKVFHKDTLTETKPINVRYPKILSENDVIKGSDKWRTGKLTFIKLHQDYDIQPGNIHVTSSTYEGAWFKTDAKYIGIRYHNRCGWIKIGVSSYSFKLYSFALSKN